MKQRGGPMASIMSSLGRPCRYAARFARLSSWLAQRDRKKDQQGKRRTRGQNDGKGNTRRKRQCTGEGRSDRGAAHLHKTEQRGCQPGLAPDRMERERSAERIDQT